MIPTGIITIGDCPSNLDFNRTAGPVLRRAVAEAGWQTIAEAIVPDDAGQIARTVRSFAQQGCHLILTSGGTGLSAKDVAPESVRSVARLEVPGVGELMRSRPEQAFPDLVLSRGLGAVVEESLVIVLPGGPAAALAGFGSVTGIIPSAVARLQDGAAS